MNLHQDRTDQDFTRVLSVLFNDHFSTDAIPPETERDQNGQADRKQEAALTLQVRFTKNTFDRFIRHDTSIFLKPKSRDDLGLILRLISSAIRPISAARISWIKS